jgi:hypothetical protein
MKKENKISIIVTLMACLISFQTSFAQIDLPEEFEENTIDTVPVSDALPMLVIGATLLAFVYFKKMKAVVK